MINILVAYRIEGGFLVFLDGLDSGVKSLGIAKSFGGKFIGVIESSVLGPKCKLSVTHLLSMFVPRTCVGKKNHL